MTVIFMRKPRSALTLLGCAETDSGTAHEPGELVTAHGVDAELKECRLAAQLGPDARPERENTRLEPSDRTAGERNAQWAPEDLAPRAEDGCNRRLHF
jgi:hypothetical protein